MKLDKIKEILRNKKVQIIGGAVAGVLIITVAGSIIVHNKNTENKSIAVEKSEKKDTNKSSDKEKKEAEKELEELKKVDTSNLSDEEKKDLENKIAEAEKKVENNNTNSSSNKEVIPNNSKETSSTSNSGTSSSSKNSDSSSSTSKPSVVKEEESHSHTHNWVPITETIYHEEEGHWEEVVVTPAWTESIPVYEEREVVICNVCGADITGNVYEHDRNHMLNGEGSGYRNEWKQVQVGTETINHPAVTEKKWIIDKAAWTETVTKGYKCSECGETK